MSDHDHLITIAKQSRENAHAPYSNFRVGAALRATSGRIFGGCNVENATYGLTVCAERIAIFKAISEGERGFDTIVRRHGHRHPHATLRCLPPTYLGILRRHSCHPHEPQRQNRTNPDARPLPQALRLHQPLSSLHLGIRRGSLGPT